MVDIVLTERRLFEDKVGIATDYIIHKFKGIVSCPMRLINETT